MDGDGPGFGALGFGQWGAESLEMRHACALGDSTVVGDLGGTGLGTNYVACGCVALLSLPPEPTPSEYPDSSAGWAQRASRTGSA